MHGLGLRFQEITEVHLEDVYDAHPRARCDDRGERFEVRVVLVRREENEFFDTSCFPGVDEIIECSMERLAAQRGIPGKSTLGIDVHAIFERRCSQDPKFGGEVVREMLNDDRVAAERHVWTVLLTCTDGHDQSGVASEGFSNLGGTELLQAQGLGRRTRVRRGERLSHSR